MTTTIELTEAVLTLSEYFGTRYDASRLGGRRAMTAVISTQFALSHQEAGELLDALEQTRAIRWISQPGADWMQSWLGLEIELGYWKLQRSVR
jgi:hypothetical protein